MLDKELIQSLQDDIDQTVNRHYMFPLWHSFNAFFGTKAVSEQFNAYHIMREDDLLDHLKGYIQTLMSGSPHDIETDLVRRALDKISQIRNVHVSHWIVPRPEEAGYLDVRPVDHTDLSDILDKLVAGTPRKLKWSVAGLKDHVQGLDKKSGLAPAIDFLSDYFGSAFDDQLMYDNFQGYDDTIKELMGDIQDEVEDWTVATVDPDTVQDYLQSIKRVERNEAPYWSTTEGFRPITRDDLFHIIEDIAHDDPSTVRK